MVDDLLQLQQSYPFAVTLKVVAGKRRLNGQLPSARARPTHGACVFQEAPILYAYDISSSDLPPSAAQMSPYVVPDRAQPDRKLSTTLTPTFWATLTIVPFDDLDPAQSKAIPHDDVPAQVSVSSDESTSTSMQPSKLDDPPPVRHEYFYFDDGNITFLVEGILYRVHQYFFFRDSSEFRDRLSRLAAQQESSSSPVIPLDDVKSVDFDAFLSVLYPLNFNKLEERTFEEWSSILDLSTRWGFTSIRDLTLRCVKPPNPLQQLILARKYAIEKWINPAIMELCKRQEALSLEEARLVDFEDVVLIGSIRQTVRSPTPTVGGAGIRECIEAWRNGEPWQPVSELPDTCAMSPRTPSPEWGISLPPPLDPITMVSSTMVDSGDSWPSYGLKKKKGKKK